MGVTDGLLVLPGLQPGEVLEGLSGTAAVVVVSVSWLSEVVHAGQAQAAHAEQAEITGFCDALPVETAGFCCSNSSELLLLELVWGEVLEDVGETDVNIVNKSLGVNVVEVGIEVLLVVEVELEVEVVEGGEEEVVGVDTGVGEVVGTTVGFTAGFL